MDDGRLTDGPGRTVDFDNTVPRPLKHATNVDVDTIQVPGKFCSVLRNMPVALMLGQTTTSGASAHVGETSPSLCSL